MNNKDLIESLEKDIDACISDRNNMEKAKENMKKETLEIASNNARLFFDEEYNTLVAMLAHFDSAKVRVKDNMKKTYNVSDDLCIVLEYRTAYSDGTQILSHKFYDREKGFCIGFSDKDMKYWFDWLGNSINDRMSDKSCEMILELFGTEEKTLHTLDVFRMFVCDVLQSMHDAISESNDKLS
jgi:hypothetical protein